MPDRWLIGAQIIQYGIPSILASAYQSDDFAKGLFHEDPYKVGISIWEEGGKKYKICDLIESIFKLKDSDYLEMVRQTYEALRNNYDINLIFSELFERKMKCVDSYNEFKRIINIKRVYENLV